MSGWPPRRLEDLCTPRKEFVAPSRDGSNRYVGLEHLDSGFAMLRRWGVDAGLRSAKARFYRGDVLYGKLRPYLDKAAVAEWEGVCSTDILVLSPKRDETDPSFLAFLLHSPAFLKHAIDTTAGVNHPRTSWASVGEFEQPVPLLPAQRAIATVLSKLQAAVDVQDRTVAALKDLKAATMAKVFREGLRGERLKQTEIGEIPESWSVLPIKAIARIMSSTLSFAEIANHISPAGDRHRIMALKVSDMNLPGNETRLETATTVFHAGRDFVQKYTIPIGSIVFPKRGAAIATNKKRVTVTPTILDPNLIALVPQAEINPAYLCQWILTFDIASIQEPGAIPQLNKKSVEPVLVPFPADLEEQAEIGRVLGTVDERLHLAVRRSIVLNRLFSALLADLMAGKARIPNSSMLPVRDA